MAETSEWNLDYDVQKTKSSSLISRFFPRGFSFQRECITMTSDVSESGERDGTRDLIHYGDVARRPR